MTKKDQVIQSRYKNEDYFTIINEYENSNDKIEDESLCNVIESYIELKEIKKASALLEERINTLKPNLSEENIDIVDYLFVLKTTIFDEKNKNLSQIFFLYKNHRWILDKELIESIFAKSIYILTKYTLIGLAVMLITMVSVSYAYHRLGIVGQMTDVIVNWLFYAYIILLLIIYLVYKGFGPDQLKKKYNW